MIRRHLILTAALLTVAGSLSVFCNENGSLAKQVAEAEVEDAEEDQREDTLTADCGLLVESTLHSYASPPFWGCADIANTSGRHHKRGPPLG